jgi:uncharacterized SAM-binding protein YcdF (DUF218 family)
VARTEPNAVGWARRLQVVTATAAVLVLLWPVVDIAVSTAWSHRRVDAGRLDAVVVLGSSLDAGRPTPLLERRAERAAELVAQARAEGGDPWVVASGGVTGATAFDAEPVSEADALGARLVELGVPRERLLLEERALSTSDNLALSMPLLQATDTGVHRVAVVTSDGHVARVRLLLSQAVADGRVDAALDVVVVGAATPLADVRQALVREVSLVAGQRADTALTSALDAALQQTRRLARGTGGGAGGGTADQAPA